MRSNVHARAALPAVAAGVVALLCLALGACASHELRCEGKLEPINPPAPQSATTLHADAPHGP
jgi:hypothetical protein